MPEISRAAGRVAIIALLLTGVLSSTVAIAAPYLRQPNYIPGILQAERFDEGGEGVAYHDSTIKNEPGQFRAESVDIEKTADCGGGYDVGWVTPGEWLQYSVRIDVDGQYAIGVRYAAKGYGGQIHIEADGANVTGPIDLPDTGGWQRWQTLWVNDIPLSQYNQTLRVVFDKGSAEGWLANFNFIEIRNLHDPQPPFSGYAPLLPAKVQAEKFDKGGEGVAYHDSTPQNEPGKYRVKEGVDIERTADSGGGYDVGWVTPGEWLEYTLRNNRNGFITAQIRYAAKGPGGTMHIELDDTDITGPIELADTGGWQTWKTVEARLNTLSPLHPGGLITPRLVFDNGNPEGWLANINFVQINNVRENYPENENTPYLEAQFEAEHFDWGGEGVAYHDTTEANEPGAFRSSEGPDIEVTQDEGGGFDVGWIKPGEWLLFTTYHPFDDVELYTIEVRYACLGDGGTMHIEFNGVDKTGPIELTNTGSWKTWKTITIPNVPLAVGAADMRLAFDRGNAQGLLANINWVRITGQR
ncbi:MAG: carbohydrate-binding protein [Gammaproteobacteria bacterium]|nr:carbohydrate-binding protein [Gammaproteobacteria bacterium]